jgi:hypothetical protein
MAPVQYPAAVNYDPLAGQVPPVVAPPAPKPVTGIYQAPFEPVTIPRPPAVRYPAAENYDPNLGAAREPVPAPVPNRKSVKAPVKAVTPAMQPVTVGGTAPFASDLESKVIAPIQPQAAGSAAANGTENTSGLLKNLTNVVKKSADTNAETIAEHAGTIGHDLTTAKNATIAQHLADNGVTPAQWDALSMDDKNAWVNKVNAAKKTKYDPFGSNYRPGGYGRPAEEGARQVSDALRKVSK